MDYDYQTQWNEYFLNMSKSECEKLLKNANNIIAKRIETTNDISNLPICQSAIDKLADALKVAAYIIRYDDIGGLDTYRVIADLMVVIYELSAMAYMGDRVDFAFATSLKLLNELNILNETLNNKESTQEDNINE